MVQSSFLYILQCSDGSYYVGTTNDLEQRLLAHNEGRAAVYTTIRLPVRLVYSEEHNSIEKALARERQIKRWTRAKKEALISGSKKDLKRFSKRGHRVKKQQ
jgi:putative endonuclease